MFEFIHTHLIAWFDLEQLTWEVALICLVILRVPLLLRYLRPHDPRDGRGGAPQ